MVHRCGYTQRSDKTQQRMHLRLVLVHIIQLLKNLIKVLHVRVDRLRPALKTRLHRQTMSELVIYHLHTRDERHQCIALEADGRLQIPTISETIVFGLDIGQRISHSHPGAANILALKAPEFCQIALLLSDLLFGS